VVLQDQQGQRGIAKGSSMPMTPAFSEPTPQFKTTNARKAEPQAHIQIVRPPKTADNTAFQAAAEN
jgi:hypothetical protein